MDAHALIVVGLTVDKLDITTMPLYEEFKELVDEGVFLHTFDELVGEFYYEKNNLPDSFDNLQVIKPHWDGSGDKETVVGWVIEASSDWTPKEINLFQNNLRLPKVQQRFWSIFHTIPKVYLVPRYW